VTRAVPLLAALIAGAAPASALASAAPAAAQEPIPPPRGPNGTVLGTARESRTAGPGSSRPRNSPTASPARPWAASPCTSR
jgi:hypothetical protein